MVINTGESRLDLRLPLAQLGLPGEGDVCARDVWAKREVGKLRGAWWHVNITQHDSAFYVFRRCAPAA